MDIIYNDLPYLQKLLFTHNVELNDDIKSLIFKKYLQKNSLTTPSNGGLQYQNTTIWYDLYLFSVINYLTSESRLNNPLVIIRKRLHQNLIKIFVKKYEELLKNNKGSFHEASSVLKAYLTDMIQELIDSRIPVEPVFISGKWCEIDTMQDLKIAEKIF